MNAYLSTLWVNKIINEDVFDLKGLVNGRFVGKKDIDFNYLPDSVLECKLFSKIT